MLAGVPAPPGGAVAQRLRGCKSAEPEKTVKRSSRRTGVNLQFFPVQPSSLGLKGASSPFFVAPARRNRWHFSGSLLVSKENIPRQAETFHQQRRPRDARAVHAGNRGRERHRMGTDGAGAALRHRAAADGAHRGLPAAAVGLLDAAYPRRYPDRPERHRPYRPRGTGHQPVPEPVHRAGVHHRHRQPCGSGHRHPFRRGGGRCSGCGSWRCWA